MKYDIDAIKSGMRACARKALISKPLLTRLDSFSGDGDLGISMEKGARALLQEIETFRGKDIGELLQKCAVALNCAAPSTMGTLLSSAMLMLGKKYKERTELTGAELAHMPEHMAYTIMVRGNAVVGDKTILDALIPLSKELIATYARTQDLRQSIVRAARVTKEAAKATKGLCAKVGRAKWIANRSREYPDSGAVLCALLVDALAYPDKPEGYRLPNYEM